MEERAVSPAHEEEVVELLDIVQSAEAAEGSVDEGGEVVELAPEDIEAFADGEEEPLMLVDVLSRGDGAEQGEALPLDRLVLPGNAEEPCGTGEAPQAQEAPAPEDAPSFVEEAAIHSDLTFLEERHPSWTENRAQRKGFYQLKDARDGRVIWFAVDRYPVADIRAGSHRFILSVTPELARILKSLNSPAEHTD